MEWICANEVTPISDTYFNVSGLHEGIDYAFRVAAENRAGLGSYSEVSSPVKCYVHKGQSSVSVIPRVLRITSLSTSQTIVRQLGHAFCILCKPSVLSCVFDTVHEMRPIVTDVGLSMICACLCVAHMGGLCENGWIDRDAVCGGWLMWVRWSMY